MGALRVLAVGVVLAIGASAAAAASTPTEKAREVLSDRRYQRTFPSTSPVVRHPGRDDAPLGAPRAWTPPPPPLPGAGEGLMTGLGLIVGGLVVATVMVAVSRALARRRRAGKPARRSPSSPPALGPKLGAEADDDTMLAARALAAAGREAEAVLLLWRAAVQRLDPDAEVHLTGREVVARLRRAERLPAAEGAAAMATLLAAMEASRFARAPTRCDDVERCIAALAFVRPVRDGAT